MAPCSRFLKDEVIPGRPRAVRRAPTTLGLSGPAGRATARATESVIHGEPAAPAPVLEAEVTGSPSSASSAGGLLPFKGRAGLIPAPGLSTCAQARPGTASPTIQNCLWLGERLGAPVPRHRHSHRVTRCSRERPQQERPQWGGGRTGRAAGGGARPLGLA